MRERVCRETERGCELSSVRESEGKKVFRRTKPGRGQDRAGEIVTSFIEEVTGARSRTHREKERVRIG
jgi:hypothetical protein